MSGGSSSSSGGLSSTPKVKNKSRKGTERDRGDMGSIRRQRGCLIYQVWKRRSKNGGRCVNTMKGSVLMVW